MTSVIIQAAIVAVCAFVAFPASSQALQSNTRTSYAKREIDGKLADLRKEIEATLQKRVDAPLVALENRLLNAVAIEAALRDEDIKLLKDKRNDYDWTKLSAIVISILAFGLSLFVWWDGRRRAKQDRAEGYTDMHFDLSQEISEAKGSLQGGKAQPGTREYAQIVKVGNFFERVAKAWTTNHATRDTLRTNFEADMKDFWARATSASFQETSRWSSLEKMVERMP